jgi:sugar lactone lactonase YvrE
MGNVALMLVIQAIVGFSPEGPPAIGKTDDKASTAELRRTIPLDDVRGAVDRSGIAGRIDHMRYDPETKRLFIACVANGSLEVIDLEKGSRAGSISGLAGPQGVAVAGGWVYVATGDDGKLHRFHTRTLAADKSVAVGDDADNVRVAGDGKVWVSFGGTGPGGLACFDADSLTLEKKFSLPRMPEGFQIHESGKALFANMPAGKRSKEDGTVVGLKVPGGDFLWERKLIGHAGNFPMALDSANDRVFVISRGPARLICLNARDGSILGETTCPPESDDLFFDPRSGLVAVIGGGSQPSENDPGGVGASLDLFTIDGSGKPSKLGGTPLPPQSRTGALAVDRRTIYVGVPMAKDRPAEIREYRLPK